MSQEPPRGALLKRIGKRKSGKSLGPVSNLEEYVPQDWWSRIFNSLYLKTDADVVEDQKITKQEVDLFTSVLQLSKEDRILDLCCGQGRHSLELARRGFKHLYGLDRSRYLIQKAKYRARKENLCIKFKEGDARKLSYPTDNFDVVMILGNSFGYFESIHDDLRVLEEVRRVLKPWGKLLIDVADGNYLRENFQPRSWEWIGKKYFVCRERSLSVDKQRLISREVITYVNKGVVADQFYAERLYSRELLSEILDKAKFSQISFHGQISPNSQRNQDLGMMEKRIIITATVKKEWSGKPKETSRTKNVVVLLGDPSKKDIVKPNSVFDEDDYYAIDRLKGALKELKDYNFYYLTEHASLIHDLEKLKPKVDFVLNLCDEGYENDPLKEPHIPALLEILDIPYTGSGPQAIVNCFDKLILKGIAKEMNIPVPASIFVTSEDSTFELPFNFPGIVKPAFGDGSFGITQSSVVNNMEQLFDAVSELRYKLGYDKEIIIEEFLPGKDLSVGIIGNPPESYRILPIIEADYSSLPPEYPHISGYESKWLPNSPYWKLESIPANLPEQMENFIIEMSLKLFARLKIKDYARFDWRLDANGTPKFLEANPNPGWCWDGHLAKMAQIAGITYTKMLEMILSITERRIKIRGNSKSDAVFTINK